MTTESLAPEFLWFNASKSYSDNPTNTVEEVTRASKGRGLLALRYGFEEQNPSRGIWLMVWKNLEEHNAFMRCEKYVDFALPIMEAMVGHGEITQALLTQHQDFFWAIASPVTQFIYITLHPRHDRHSELTPLLEELTGEMALVPGCYGGSWGPSIQHDNLCVGVVGWRSIADWDVSVIPAFALIQKIGNIQARFARLS